MKSRRFVVSGFGVLLVSAAVLIAAMAWRPGRLAPDAPPAATTGPAAAPPDGSGAGAAPTAAAPTAPTPSPAVQATPVAFTPIGSGTELPPDQTWQATIAAPALPATVADPVADPVTAPATQP